ncbi:MAG: hypothetical protein ACI9ME_000561 [Ilumatobacter sp.]|jgi:hypothetical protein
MLDPLGPPPTTRTSVEITDVGLGTKVSLFRKDVYPPTTMRQLD